MKREGRHCWAIVLAAGSGKRMQSSTAKQFMHLGGRPLICYSLQAVEKSEIIDDCILVAQKADMEYVRREIVERYGFRKVVAVVEGGRERYESVWNALRVIAGKTEGAGDIAEGKSLIVRAADREEYVFIQDGARPFLTEEILQDTFREVCRYHACVAAVPAKDTVKLADEEGFASETPDRRLVWTVQTPQVFEKKLILEAYGKLAEEMSGFPDRGKRITDDASVVELFTDCKVRLVRGSYQNIKITTPEDMRVAEAFLEDWENAL